MKKKKTWTRRVKEERKKQNQAKKDNQGRGLRNE
jgi:hypothetical protein